MSELIDMDKMGPGRGDLAKKISFAMLEIMVAYTEGPDLKPWQKTVDSGNMVFDVDMKIDGVEVKFSTIIKHLFDQYEIQMEKAVVEKIGEMFTKLQIEQNNVLDQLKTKYGVY
jgi:hypothetical protein